MLDSAPAGTAPEKKRASTQETHVLLLPRKGRTLYLEAKVQIEVGQNELRRADNS